MSVHLANGMTPQIEPLTTRVDLWKHALDGYLYISAREATQADDSCEVFEYEGKNMVVDGLLELHVDDILACGEGVYSKDDVKEPVGAPTCFSERPFILLKRFKFGSVDYGDNQTFCGCQVQQTMGCSAVSSDLQRYLRRLKPLSVEKSRRRNPDEKVTPKEQSQLRGLSGGLARPANQTQPHLSAPVSIAQAGSANTKVSDLLEANFAKMAADIPLKQRSH